MDNKDLMAILDYVDKSSLAYVDFKTNASHLVISKEVPGFTKQPEQTQPVSTQNEPVVVEAESAVETVVEDEKEGTLVETPMVGVVYLQPQPDADPYVKVGDRVEQGQVVCLVEAMKLMNEIQAPVSGVVTEILVDSEAVVEFNQPLMRIE